MRKIKKDSNRLEEWGSVKSTEKEISIKEGLKILGRNIEFIQSLQVELGEGLRPAFKSELIKKRNIKFLIDSRNNLEIYFSNDQSVNFNLNSMNIAWVFYIVDPLSDKMFPESLKLRDRQTGFQLDFKFDSNSIGIEDILE